jgi:S1-C subfamily serine protease
MSLKSQLLLPLLFLSGLIVGSPSKASYTPLLVTPRAAMAPGAHTASVDANDLAWLPTAKESTVAVYAPGLGHGSGVCIKRVGDLVYVLTAEHVAAMVDVDPDVTLTIQVARGDTDYALPAVVVRRDPLMDLALLAVRDVIHALPITPLAEGLPADGAIVYTLGYPAAIYPVIARVGFVVAVGGDESREEVYHTTGIWFGDSGGPLLNRQGKLIGINVQISSRPHDNQGWFPDSNKGIAVSLNSILLFLEG